MLKLIIALGFFVGMCFHAGSQTFFEGRISYKISLLGEGADEMAAFMPESYDYVISGDNLSFKMNGGMVAMMMGRFIFQGSSKKTFMIKDDEQTAYEIEQNDDEETEKPEIKKLNEIITILGHKCQKYEVKVANPEQGVEAIQYIWVTTDIKLKQPKGKMQSGGNLFVEGIEGFPLKMMTTTMGVSMVLVANEVKQEKVPESEFQVPKGYEIKQLDPSTMFGGQ